MQHAMQTLRGVMVLLALIAIMTACGKATLTEEQDTLQTQQAVQAESEPQVATHNEWEPRTFGDEFGTFELKEQPQRIIALYMEDYLAALGITPITQTVIGNFSLQYLQPYVADLPAIDTSAIDFEAVLAASPDLTLLAFPSYASEGKYEQFSKIAPTYVFDADTPNNWRDALVTVGELTGKEEEARQVLADYEAKVEAAKAELHEVLGEETVAVIRVRSNKELRLYGGPGGYVGNVLYQDLGLNPPQIVKDLVWGEQSMAVVSQEIIPDIDADHLIFTYDEGGKELAEEIVQSEIWRNLPAVKNNRIYEVTMEHWMTYGPIAYNHKVDDVLRLLGKDAQ